MRRQAPISISSRCRPGCRRGISLAEVLVVIGIMSIGASLILPAIGQSRERSRAVSCKNNLRQLVIAAHGHEAANGAFPYTSTSWYDSSKAPPERYRAISAHRRLMAHLDPTLYAKIDFEDPADPAWKPMPPNWFLAAGNRQLQAVRVPVLACPSDNVPAGATSYRANLGISPEVLPPSATIEAISQKGAFVNGRAVRVSEFTDGLSQTALFSERVVGDYNPGRYDPFRDIFATGDPIQGADALVRHCRDRASAKPKYEFSFAGGSWLFGGWLNSWYAHELTPNSQIPDCGLGSCCADGGLVIVTARSLHPGAVHVAMADGSVRSVSNQIDSLVWRAAGTRNGGEVSRLD